jgi:hypothetical protein
MPIANPYNLVEPRFRPRATARRTKINVLYRTYTEESSAFAHRGRRGRFRCRRLKKRLAGEKPLIEIVWVLDHDPNLSTEIGQGCTEENERDKKQNPDTSLVRQFEKRRYERHNHEEEGRQCAADRPKNSAVDEFGARIQKGYVDNPDKIGRSLILITCSKEPASVDDAV